MRQKCQTKIEQLLSVFDQKKATSDSHILNVNERYFPEQYRPLIRLIQRAIAEPLVRETMAIEDEILEDLQDLKRQIEKKDKTIEEKDRQIEELKKKLTER